MKAVVPVLILGLSAAVGCAPKPELSARDLANYAGQVTFADFKVGVAENMAGQSVYYIDALVRNGGDRGISELRVRAGFRDLEGQVVFRDSATVINPRHRGLGPAQSRTVRMGFENVPATWNRAAPDIEIIHLAFE